MEIALINRDCKNYHWMMLHRRKNPDGSVNTEPFPRHTCGPDGRYFPALDGQSLRDDENDLIELAEITLEDLTTAEMSL